MDFLNLRLRWYDCWLKEIDNGVDREPTVRIFVMGGGSGRKTASGRLDHGGHWRSETDSPIPDAKIRPYYLHHDGTLASAKPSEADSFRDYVFDPRDPVPTIGGTVTSGKSVMVGGAFDQRESPDVFGSQAQYPAIAERSDVLVFQTEALADDIEVTGPITAMLWISSDCVDTDFTLKLIDVHPPNKDYPSGYAMNLTDGILRARYRDSWEKPAMMTPGEVYRVRIDAFATSNLFLRGHHLRIDISSRQLPAFRRKSEQRRSRRFRRKHAHRAQPDLPGPNAGFTRATSGGAETQSTIRVSDEMIERHGDHPMILNLHAGARFQLGATAVLLALFTATPALAQINAGESAASANKPFTVTKVADFNLPWRMAFLPDGRMLVSEKGGKLLVAKPDGGTTEVTGVPAVQFQKQNGLLGVYLAPSYAEDHDIYLTYSEPGEDPSTSSLALARATLELKAAPALSGLKVIWRDPIKGKGGQVGATIAFSPDRKLLYLTAGERQRFTPAQDINQPAGKILRLTLDGKPAPGNPMAGKKGASTVDVIDPPKNTEAAKTAPVVRRFTFTGPNFTPSETWSSGHRTPYGLAFAPDGRLWEIEHGPYGGDELNLIEPGKNYGWPLVSYGMNYDGTPIPSPDSRPDLAKPVIYWVPVIAPGNLMFYSGSLFPQWKGSAFAGGMESETLNRIIVNGATARPAERWPMNFRVRDVEQGLDGALWLLEDSETGGLYRLTPK